MDRVTMTHCVRVVALAAFVTTTIAGAPPIAAARAAPPIRTAADNQMPTCATPGRMMALLKTRNIGLDTRFDTIATEYMRHGEALGVRWDYAFFQMIVETGALSFKNGNRQGDVRPEQYNFAGLGATGNGERGERFPDVATGARAHLEHLMLYAGAPVATPVAERTRKVAEWGVLTSWQKAFKKPITFQDLAKKWAPGTGSYASMIDSVADQFYDEFCKTTDPRPELVAEARGQSNATVVETKLEPREPKVSGVDLAKKAIADGKAEDQNTRTGLGATGLAKQAFKLLNPDAASAPQVDAAPPIDSKPASIAGSKPNEKPLQTASAAAAARPAVQAPVAAGKCRVWTASYGGQKSIIIRAMTDGIVNFTVLDVNEGAESREAEAFIAAYAKGGSVAGEFANQTSALDKAFELCPEG
jgi:hypothetical protein